MARRIAPIAVLVLSLAFVPLAGAHPDLPENPASEHMPHVDAESHDAPDEHSENMRLVANWTDGEYREGSDLAFWGHTAVLGNYGNPGGFRLLDITVPSAPKLQSQFVCPGGQADVSIWHNLVFMSVDTPMTGPECGAASAPASQWAAGEAWEGIRVVSIANPEKPEQIAAVDTDCGSHTHTLYPQPDHRAEDGTPDPRVLVYVSSYPLTTGTSPECNASTHRKISVIEVPLRDPASAQVVSTPDVSPAIGCHDITVFVPEQLAAAACISESQLWDLSDPVNPTVVSHIVNPAMEIHHSSAFSWDGDVLVLGDEMGGAAAAAGCLAGGHAPTGSLWFYDISDPANPAFQSYFTIPQDEPSLFCTAHNFNVVPMRGDTRVLTTAWYNGGTHVLDFTDPTAVEQIGWYKPNGGAAWSSYWYNGHVYANNFDASYVPPVPESRGFDVFAIDHPALAGALALPHLNPQTQQPLPTNGRSAEARGMR